MLELVIVILVASYQLSVEIVTENTRLLTGTVPLSSANMRLLQSNIQSINTSKSLLNAAITKNEIDVVVLQEVWKPKDEMILHGFNKPVLKLRDTLGGGVAIAVSDKAMCVKADKYDMKGLEAVWADVKVGKVRTMVGSVYINVGKIKEIELLDKVLERVLKENTRVILAMDANARNSLWDNSEIKKNSMSRKMGTKLEEVIFKHNLYVLSAPFSLYTGFRG